MPPDRWRHRAVVVVLLGLVMTPLAACGSDSDSAAQSAVGPKTGAGPALTPSTTPVTPSRTTAAPRSSSTTVSSSTRPAPSPLTTVPSRSRQTQPAQPLSGTGSFGAGVTVSVVATTAVAVVGRGPGELSGPALAYRLRLSNRGGSAIDLGNAVVTAAYGSAAVPAQDSSSPPSSPWTGSLDAGGAAMATYVFLIPVTDRRAVSLTISYDPRQPVVVLRS